jgi:hypothetical protein
MRRVLCALALLATCTYVLSTLSFRNVEASRNSSGTYSLANPSVTSNQLIGSGLWNTQFNDISTALTDSLDRNGKGPMLAPLRLPNGTVAAPALTFDSDTDTGFYRIGADNIGVAIGGTKVFEWSSTGGVVPSGKTLTFPAASVTTLTPETNIAAANGLGYWKDPAGIVHLKGKMTNNTGGTATTLVASTPIAAGFRPTSTRQFPCASDTSTVFTIVVGTGGAITASAVGAAFINGSVVYVDGINYLAEQ